MVHVSSVSSALSQQAASACSSRWWESCLPHAVIMLVWEGTFPPRQRSNLNCRGRVTLRLRHPRQDSEWQMCIQREETMCCIFMKQMVQEYGNLQTLHCGLLGAVVFWFPSWTVSRPFQKQRLLDFFHWISDLWKVKLWKQRFPDS